MIFKNKTVLLISPEAWGKNHISKHHYALALQQKGNIVFFLNPPGQLDNVSKLENGIFVIDYKLPIRGANRLPFFLNNLISKLNAAKIKSLAKTTFDIVFSFDPFRFQNPNVFGKKLIKIYYIADLHKAKFEKKLIEKSHLVISVSKPILDRFSDTRVPKYFINHAISEIYAEKSIEKLKNLQIETTLKNKAINCGYVGNLLSRYIDYETIIKIIKSNPEVNFCFIGPYQKNNLGGEESEFAVYINILKELKNVQLLGSKSPSEVAVIIQDMDLFLIAYNADKYPTEVSNSHKLMEYLSTGKVIVANKTLTYQTKEYEGLIIMSEKNSDLVEIFKMTIDHLDEQNCLELTKKRINFALENSYPKQIEKIEQFLSELGF